MQSEVQNETKTQRYGSVYFLPVCYVVCVKIQKLIQNKWKSKNHFVETQSKQILSITFISKFHWVTLSFDSYVEWQCSIICNNFNRIPREIGQIYWNDA